MAALNLVLGRGTPKTRIDVLTLDAAMEISHEHSATVSKNPIEDGSDTSDNVRIENPTLTISGIISEAPLNLQASAFNIFTGAAAGKAVQKLGSPYGAITGAALGSLGGLMTNRKEGDINFPRKAFEFLIELEKKRQPIVIETSLRTYSNMILTKLSVPQSALRGKSLEFSATFEQISLVKTSTVLIPEKNVKKSGAASKQNLGKQAAKEATEATQKGSSILFGAFKKVGSLF